MKATKKILISLAVITLLASLFALSIFATERSGDMLVDGDNKLTYKFVDGVLTIDGSADGLRFTGVSVTWDGTNSVWKNEGWNEEITEVIVNANVGYVGKYVLSNLPNCTKITIPASVTTTGTGAFAGNAKLIDIRVTGADYSDMEADGVEHFYDLRNFTWIENYTFDATANEKDRPATEAPIVLLFGKGTWIGFGKFFQNYWSKPLTCYFAPGANAETVMRDMQVTTIENDPKYEICDKIVIKYYASSIAATPVKGEIITSNNSSWPAGISYDLNLETGTLYLNTTGSLSFKEFNWTTNSNGWLAWRNVWKNAVKRIEIGPYSKVLALSGLVGGFTYCEEILFTTQFTIDTTGFNCPKLKTVGFISGYETNVIDLSVVRPNTSAQNLLANCTEVTSVKFPETNTFGQVAANMFAGCTSLESITLPSYITEISATAFSGCTALKTVNLGNPAVTIAADAFSGCSGVTINVESFFDAKKVNATLESAGISSSVATATAVGQSGGMSFNGYQIRVDGYNGLRSIYSYDESVISMDTGFNFVEYGTIAAKKDNYNSYTESIGESGSILSVVNGEIITPADNIIKTMIRDADGYHNKYYTNEDGSIGFNTVIVKYTTQAQIMTDVAIVGYEVWEKDGVYYAFFTKGSYGDNGDISLYKATLGMLADEVVDLGRNENSPVWKTLELCDSTSVESSLADVSVLTFADPANDGKNIAVILNNTAETITLENLDFIASDVKTGISRYVFEETVNFNYPSVASYWQAHINEKVSDIPAGKSFIYIVDTHWEGNERKSTDLIKYVRSLTGIETVIHGGDSFDSYSSDTAIADSKAIFSDAMGTNFYTEFGDDGLFTVGNHDSNYTGWDTAKKAGETEGSESGFWKYALPDSYIYETTTKNLEGKISLDNDLITKINNGTIVFADNGGYTADQMKAEALAWAKMHYTYDDEANKIRYIVLNTNDCGLTSYYTFGEMYESILKLQYDWLYSVLLDTATNKSDYDVVIAGHSLASSSGIAVGWQFYDILRAFKSGGTSSFSLTAATDNSAAAIGDLDKSYSFSGTTYSGTVFTVNGHAHVERTWIWQNGAISAYSADSTLANDAILSIMCLPDSTTGGYPYELTGEAGTITEQSFTVITITDEGKIVCTKIGAGSDRVINYK